MKNTILRLSYFLVAFFIFAAVSVSYQSVFAQKRLPVFRTVQQPANSVKDFTGDEDEIFRLINLERRKRRLNNLEWDEQIAKMARKYSEKMARENFFSHFDPEGTNVAERAKKAKIKGWNKIGENLFSIDGVSKFDAFAVKGWMKSPSHQRNILDGDWTTTGVGVAEAENGEIFITQVFVRK